AVKMDGDFHHQWFLGLTEQAEASEDEMAQALDDILKAKNKNYRVARSKALKGIHVSLVKADDFHDWNAQKKQKGGQVKTPRMMDEESLKQFEQFVKTK
ncbi:MAG TPA: GH3 auxin-responsive promoter family protein, partial [Roseivirga sp.]